MKFHGFGLLLYNISMLPVAFLNREGNSVGVILMLIDAVTIHCDCPNCHEHDIVSF